MTIEIKRKGTFEAVGFQTQTPFHFSITGKNDDSIKDITLNNVPLIIRFHLEIAEPNYQITALLYKKENGHYVVTHFSQPLNNIWVLKYEGYLDFDTHYVLEVNINSSGPQSNVPIRRYEFKTMDRVEYDYTSTSCTFYFNIPLKMIANESPETLPALSHAGVESITIDAVGGETGFDTDATFYYRPFGHFALIGLTSSGSVVNLGTWVNLISHALSTEFNIQQRNQRTNDKIIHAYMNFVYMLSSRGLVDQSYISWIEYPDFEKHKVIKHQIKVRHSLQLLHYLGKYCSLELDMSIYGQSWEYKNLSQYQAPTHCNSTKIKIADWISKVVESTMKEDNISIGHANRTNILNNVIRKFTREELRGTVSTSPIAKYFNKQMHKGERFYWTIDGKATKEIMNCFGTRYHALLLTEIQVQILEYQFHL